MSSNSASVHADLRMAQINEENDHKRVTVSSHSTLLKEKLDALRLLVKQVADDNWKYEEKKPTPPTVTQSERW